MSNKSNKPDTSQSGNQTGDDPKTGSQAASGPDGDITRTVHSNSILNITNIVMLLLMVGLVAFFIRILPVFGLFIFSFIFAFLLFPMVEWLTERRVNRVVAILIVFVIIFGFLFGIGAAIFPVVIDQAIAVLDKIPDWYQQGIYHLEVFRDYLNTQGFQPEDVQNYIAEITPTIHGWALGLGENIASGATVAVSWIVTALIVPIIVFYLLLDARRIHANIIGFAPRRTAAEIQRLLNRLSEMLNGYIRGLLKLSFFMFAVTTIAAWVFGVKHALLLGVLAAIAEVLPIIGPIIALVPAMAITYFDPSNHGLLAGVTINWVRALIILAFYMALQYVESNIMVPKIMGRDLNLHPLTVILALLIGAYLGGFFGVILSLPVAACLKVIFEIYYPPFIQRIEDLVTQDIAHTAKEHPDRDSLDP